MTHPIVIALVIAALVVAFGFAVYETSRPVPFSNSYTLSYSDSPAWQVSTPGPVHNGVPVTLAWSVTSPSTGYYIAATEGGQVVFSSPLSTGQGNFTALGGSLTLSLSGVADPAFAAVVTISWTDSSGLGPI